MIATMRPPAKAAPIPLESPTGTLLSMVEESGIGPFHVFTQFH
jgi:hypothetical protein